MVLVIDDDEDVRASIQDALTLKGYEVVAVENGAEAQSLMSGERTPCVVLLDLVMPVMDGWQFLSWIRLHPVHSAIPVVVVSAHASTHPPAGSTGLLRKPFAFHDLYNVVAQHCGPPP